VLDDAGIFESYKLKASHLQQDDTGKYFLEGQPADKMDDAMEEFLGFMCDLGQQGEMYVSSSPWDPLFWVTHPG
jgi:hypothetical protein